MWHSILSDNLGVNALAVSQISILDEILQGIEKHEIVIIGSREGTSNLNIKNKYISIKEYKVSFKSLFLFTGNNSILSIVSLLRHSDITLDLSEGDRFTDIYGLKIWLKQFISKFLAISFSKTYMLSPQTIGPFKTVYGNIFAKYVTRRAKATFARDQLSYNNLTELTGGLSNYFLTTDLAFRLPYDQSKYDEYFSRYEDKTTLVGINVSGLLFFKSEIENQKFDFKFKYQEFVYKLIENLVNSHYCKVILISHVISQGNPLEDDYRACCIVADELMERLQLPANDCSVEVAPKFETGTDAKSYISRLDFFIGSRMHSTIAAFSSGVPTIPVAYSRKFKGLYESLGYKYTIEPSTRTIEEAISHIESCFENRKEIKELIYQKKDIVLALIKTYVNEITRNLCE